MEKYEDKTAREIAAYLKNQYKNHTKVHFLADAYERQSRQLEVAVEGLERLGTCYCMDNFECDTHRTLARIKQIGEEPNV